MFKGITPLIGASEFIGMMSEIETCSTKNQVAPGLIKLMQPSFEDICDENF